MLYVRGQPLDYETWSNSAIPARPTSTCCSTSKKSEHYEAEATSRRQRRAPRLYDEHHNLSRNLAIGVQVAIKEGMRWEDSMAKSR